MKKPITYEIVVRGHASERLFARLRDDFSIDITPGGDTRLVGDIRDAAQLHGVINQLTSLAVEVVSLAPAGPPTPSEQPTRPKEAP